MSHILFGLDGCTDNAWVSARSDTSFTTISFEIVKGPEDVFARAASGAAFAVLDVPIGLSHEDRACDIEARKLLRHRHVCVFTPPCRESLTASTYDEAKEINRQHCRKAISQQAFNIRERIRAVDSRITPLLQRYVREGHPEVAFAALNGQQPLSHNKDTHEGIEERLILLRHAGLPSFDPHAERHRLGRSDVAVDDIVDAAVMLLTARDVARGTATKLPKADGATDARQLAMEMWMPLTATITHSKSGVRLHRDFRDNLITDRYHPDLASMRGSKRDRLRSANFEDALTWNVFKSLSQIDPSIWLPRLRAKAFPGAESVPSPQMVTTHLWKSIDPPPALRLVQKDEGPSEIDVVIETEFSVWFIEAKFKSDISTRTTNNPTRDQIIRNIDVGSWYAGTRDFDFALLILDKENSPKGVERLHNVIEAVPALAHRPDGLRNVKGRGLLFWKDVAEVLQQCAEGPLREDEKQIAATAHKWMTARNLG